MIARLLTVLLIVTIGTLAGGGPAFAQQEGQPRSLFESLFGSESQAPQEFEREQAPVQTQPAPAPQPEPAPTPAPTPEPEPAPAVEAEPAAPDADPAPQPEIVPDETAAVPASQPEERGQRIAVFGDSLAVDLTRALERLYADNPNIEVYGEAVGSSGFVRDDFFDWNAAIEEAIAADSFDVAVMMIGINDRQALNGADPLSEAWKQAYSARISAAISALEAAGKPVIWLELPPMQGQSYSADMAQVASLHRMAVFAEGGEWVETYERFSGEDGGYSTRGPDLNGNIVSMRKSDGIHFSAAGADKLAFYVDRALRGVDGGTSRSANTTGGFAIEVSDPIAGTDAAAMLRPPFQGLGEESEVLAASSVQQLSGSAARASGLLVAGATAPSGPGFTLDEMVDAPLGRADDFGIGRAPANDDVLAVPEAAAQ